MDDESEQATKLTACPNCGSRKSAGRETDEYVLEDGTKRRITFCIACVRETADGAIRYEVISEEFIRTEIDRQIHDD